MTGGANLGRRRGNTAAATEAMLHQLEQGQAQVPSRHLTQDLDTGTVRYEFTKAAHGFVVGDIVTISAASDWVKAKADAPIPGRAVGMVSKVRTSSKFTVTFIGLITGLSGLSTGTLYYLSATTAGARTATEPEPLIYVSKPVLIALNATSGIVLPWRPKNPFEEFAYARIAWHSSTDGLYSRGELMLGGSPVTSIESRIWVWANGYFPTMFGDNERFIVRQRTAAATIDGETFALYEVIGVEYDAGVPAREGAYTTVGGAPFVELKYNSAYIETTINSVAYRNRLPFHIDGMCTLATYAAGDLIDLARPLCAGHDHKVASAHGLRIRPGHGDQFDRGEPFEVDAYVQFTLDEDVAGTRNLAAVTVHVLLWSTPGTSHGAVVGDARMVHDSAFSATLATVTVVGVPHTFVDNVLRDANDVFTESTGAITATQLPYSTWTTVATLSVDNTNYGFMTATLQLRRVAGSDGRFTIEAQLSSTPTDYTHVLDYLVRGGRPEGWGP